MVTETITSGYYYIKKQEINVSTKLSKMSDQIEMSTAEKSGQNMIHQTVNFLGKPVMVQSTFTFNPAAKVNVVLNCTWTPYNTSMANAADRMVTFNSWPKQMVQKPEEMVSSGFYYTGHGDVVQCFHCGISLKYWSRTDRSNMEHRKHSPQCKFLIIAHRN